jgi:hypothetical protein
MLRQLILAAPLMALIACGPAKTSSTAAPDDAQASATAPVLKPGLVRPDGSVDYFTPYENGPLALDEFSVGPLMAQTEFSLDAIKPRFPRAEVKAAFLHQGAGESTSIITVEQGGGVLEIQGNPGTTKVGDIRISGGTPKGPRGETLMMKWADADMDYPRCWMGKDRDVHAVICTQPGEPVLRYVFGVPGWSQDALPPETVLREKAFLREFFWRGGAPAQ